MSAADHGQTGPTARHTYRLIQVLRAVAALMVVAFHSTELVADRLHLPLPVWRAGVSGIALFFVISGFVMTISSSPLRSVERPIPHPARVFLARRIERIVPLYWFATTLKILCLLAVPSAALSSGHLGSLESLRHIFASYAFLPVADQFGTREPLLVVGWTLNFEMLFYVLFALVLAFRASLAGILLPSLFAIGAIGVFIPASQANGFIGFYAHTLVYDFAFGVTLGLVARRLRWPAGLSWGVLLLGFSLLILLPSFASRWSGLTWGLPASLVVCAAIALEGKWGRRVPRWALELGDASYSLYLFHGFALPLVALLLKPSVLHRFGEGRAAALFAFGFAVLLSVVVGEVAYRLVERPLLAWFKGRRRTAIPANT